MTEEPSRWSQPFAALLGAYDAQLGFGLPSIGGKDSMSGTFNEIDVPPTLVSFAVDVAREREVITPELKNAGSSLVLFKYGRDDRLVPDYAGLKEMYARIHDMIGSGVIASAYVVDGKGLVPAVSKMAFGNGLGVEFNTGLSAAELFAPGFGYIVAEVPADRVGDISLAYTLVGKVNDSGSFTYGSVGVSMDEALKSWTGTLEKVFPSKAAGSREKVETKPYCTGDVHICKNKVARPTVFIPVFPGTNCEYDSTRAFEAAGANVVVRVFKNLDANGIRESVGEFTKAIDQAQIIMFPGGFSAGDEPDGSAKFFATAFRNEKMKEAVHRLLDDRDGLALGICNGFQALFKHCGTDFRLTDTYV
jgi:phosphoribosylformylglycinamidine synthase